MLWLQAAVLTTALSGAGETVLLDFYADWCLPCRAMAPTINALAKKGYRVRKVNIDRSPQLARRFGVGPVPCYVMLVDGQEVARTVGYTDFRELKRMCDLASPRPPQRQSPAGRLQRQPPARPPQRQSPAVRAQTPTETTGPPVTIPAVQSTPPLLTASPQPAQTPPDPASAGRRPRTPAWAPSGGGGSPLDAALIAASVRLRIEDPDGHSCGSGTIIDARQGNALILTCAHIFRDSQGKGRIEVDLFGPGGVQRVLGTLISYDLSRDVGLLKIRTPGPVATARVAPPATKIAPGTQVISVGCNNGDRPTARHSRVTSLDKFLGPPNLQVAGLPVEGRSGGGLFTTDGLVIGVCNAADPTDREGLYAAPAAIDAELDAAGLSYIYKSQDEEPVAEPAVPVPPAIVAQVAPPPLPKRMPRPSGSAPAAKSQRRPTAAPLVDAVADATPLSTEEQAALEEIRRRLEEGAEVVCVVRSRRDPQAKSEIIVLDQVSANFLKHLAAQARPQDPLMSTSLEIPRKSNPPAASPAPRDSRGPLRAAPAPRRPAVGNRPGSASGWRPRGVAPGARR